ncbi:DUF5959 family protein [Streptomyces himalayensis]|uniref:Uncharacterized protein n=1 Tax=Streptomyces himalayensis subsp. himalayensis TaxID=2756131 RepID=A0A7W0DQK1_9ACTN|nr:DUF5959 family protein [Streptomyces himalayensis]MBA2948943.1 hypothetical protein [Streptomyces himalayensis subsp. himalayensis]
MADGPIDLIRLEGAGNSVVLRITGRVREARPGAEPGAGEAASDVLAGEVLVDTPFVRGSIGISVFPEDLQQWQEALDALDAGQDIAWREGVRGPEMFIERDVDEERAHVTIKDSSMSLTTVTVTVPLLDTWFDDAYQRLDLTWEAWPPAED